ncbi:tetratricopeptide repeat protein [Robertkochia sediminum]|uniref:tetratricopeptide repeat protein n=1 Tax=Robertkochia sediminum TaxID=2785326 RepID=UPI0019317BEC|nr:tetratricopeptide repeat protein [Robertkochia sediminum]MBL7472322.1 tetratricopeptide repeat protein [Robertkochia sediminum]
MDTSNTERIARAQKALEVTKDPSEAFALKYLLADLYRRSGDREAARELIGNMITLEEEKVDRNTDHLAALYNNLGLLMADREPEEAIVALKKANQYYREQEAENMLKIAMVNYRLSELYTQINDKYYIKKYLKETALYFDRTKTEAVYEAHARAHEQLGHLFSDKLQLFDAKKHFLKALELYSKIHAEGNQDTGMIIGSLLNNLGVTYRDLESFFKAEEYFTKTLEHYEQLESSSSGYLPWIGSSLTNLSNLYATNNKKEQAIAYAEKAIRAYEHLSEEEPHRYSHYLATALHNLGVMLMEDDLEAAEGYLRRAIVIRQDLATKEPVAFNADLCSSLMNLVELYYVQWENSLNTEIKEKALALLKMVKVKAVNLPEHLPAVQNILNDHRYYSERFNDQDLSGLHFLKISGEIMKWKEEVTSTIVPQEKIPFQEHIVTLLGEHVRKFPGHYRGMENYGDALSEQAWYYMRTGNMSEALRLLKEMKALPCDCSPESRCNLAHYCLLSGDETRAKDLYKQILPLKNAEQHGMKETVLKDLQVLKDEGTLTQIPDYLRELLEHYA